MSAVQERIKEYVASVPRVEDTRRAIGPILAELCAASLPGKLPPYRGYRRLLRIGLPGEGRPHGGGALRRRAGVHSLVYLAKRKFGCPDLGFYGFAVSAALGVFSVRLDLAIDSLDEVGAPGGMVWDGDGRFAGLVREHGTDHEWMSIAALICLVHDATLTRGDAADRNGLLEEAHMECDAFPRRRMSEVHDDLVGMRLLGGPAR